MGRDRGVDIYLASNSSCEWRCENDTPLLFEMIG